ncbi:MAG TPA: RluA family pseudouridine synthase [Burkholderiales bacterium]|nr:RluA family pseudouridine synthase [Burkholderiales bacterium]
MNDLSKPPASGPRAAQLVVGEEAEAQRIDNFLLRLLKGVPKSHVYRVLRSGEVRVNSGRVGPGYRLKIGDRVRVPPVRVSQRKAPRLEPLELPIVFEDASLLVIDKPSGIAVHGGSGVSQGVIESLRAARPQAKALELAHRLDRDTSGLLAVAKKRGALRELHRMLREGEVRKTYLAAVKGVPARKEFEVRVALHKYVNARGERRVTAREGGSPAVTRARVVARSARYALLELQLLTGRTHQIRVHLAHAGHPVLGDDKYGDFALNRELAARGVHRLMLHAWRLALSHPVGGARLQLEAPVPQDMLAFLRAEFGDAWGTLER